jgi:uncharacterized protein (DUF2267 family)
LKDFKGLAYAFKDEQEGPMSGQNVSKSTMTKADIVEKVYQKIGFSKKEASELVEMVFNTLKEQLHAGEKVKILSSEVKIKESGEILKQVNRLLFLHEES